MIVDTRDNKIQPRINMYARDSVLPRSYVRGDGLLQAPKSYQLVVSSYRGKGQHPTAIYHLHSTSWLLNESTANDYDLIISLH